MNRTHLAALASALLCLAPVGCDSGPKPVTDPKAVQKAEERAEVDPKRLMGAEWRCVTVRSDGMLGGAPLTLTFGDDGRVTGSGGVNRFSGPYTTATGVVHLGPLVSTKMAGEPARMTMEQRYFDALSKADGFSLQAGLLRLKEGDRIVAEFSR